MKTVFFRVFFALVALFCVSSLMSQTLVFHLPDGSLSKVPLPATFSITPNGNRLVIESNNTQFELDKDRILSMTYRSGKGDMNDDMAVDVADIVTIVNIIAGSSTGSEGEEPEPGVVPSDDKTPYGLVAVDLGLPSGTLWANMNVGATAPYEYGFWFAWGETANKSGTYDWSTYTWCKPRQSSSNPTITKYNNKKNPILEAEDDAATVNWGDDWCTPTLEQFNELLDNTAKVWTTLNGVNGYRYVSKINGKSIFFPASGYCEQNDVRDFNSSGRYWTSSVQLGESSTDYAWQQARVLTFSDSWSGHTLNGEDRCHGLSVRPVRKN